MKVLKFGGSSVANAGNIQQVASIIKKKEYKSSIIIISAFSGITDLLIQTGIAASTGNESYKENLLQVEKRHLDTTKSLLPVTTQSSTLSLIKQQMNELEDICEGVFRLGELSLRTKDRIISFGEILSSKIFSSYLHSIGMNNEWLDGRELIKTDSNFGNAIVDFEKTNQLIQQKIKSSSQTLFITPGFIASDENNHTTTLGRGGSDYTASIFAAALNVEDMEIWTDVTGMMTADPRWVANAKTIHHISYREAMELSHFGAKVVYPPSIIPAMQKSIPIWIKNTFESNAYGTRITAHVDDEVSDTDGEIITGISSINQISLLSLEGSGMVGIPGFSKRLFEALANEKVNVILITQSSSEHSICVAVNTVDADNAKRIVDEAFDYEIKTGNVEPLKTEHEQSIIALVGDKMKSHTGIAGRMFHALGRNGVNIRAIAQGSSERNISAVVAHNDVKKAVNVLHEAFFESSHKELNVFIVGAGNVGGKLIEQIKQQQNYLLQHLNLQLKVVGIATSKKMLLDEEGIDLDNWKEQLQQSPSNGLNNFIEIIINKNLRNSVFVDVTASTEVASVYNQLLQKSIAVVACNKIAASSPYKNYHQLKLLAKEFNAPYLFETNVGAGLPVIGTLNDLIKSGDKINKIQAVLSGTLNFVFNNYNGTKTFAEVVKQAQDEGYTEPDPRLDLGGTDVMRKIMILAREAGEKIEMENIENNGFLPESCFNGSVADFYKEMEKQEAHFKKIYTEAANKNCKLKFVASYENGKASVGLQHIPAESDFYHLYGKDNIVLFYTQRYPQQPLVVKGAGAGADVTASGVFADIIRVSPQA